MEDECENSIEVGKQDLKMGGHEKDFERFWLGLRKSLTKTMRTRGWCYWIQVNKQRYDKGCVEEILDIEDDNIQYIVMSGVLFC